MFMRLAMARYRDLDSRLGLVFESLAVDQDDALADSASTMEMTSVVSQLSEMRPRIDDGERSLS